jgi:hypothetical protein
MRYLRDRHFLKLCLDAHAGECVTYRVYAGLGNRLRAHYLSELLARQLGRVVAPVWIETGQLMSNGLDIFPRASSKTRHKIFPYFICLKGKDLCDPAVLNPEHYQSKLVVLDFDAQWIPFKKSSALMKDVDAVEVCFRKEVFRARDEICARLERPFLAVHIRQTDFVTHTANSKSINYFESLILSRVLHIKKDPFKTLLIASDEEVCVSPDIERKFRSVVTLTPSFSRRERGVAAEALAHLLVLAVADDFIGSPQSSFSEFVCELRAGTIVPCNVPHVGRRQ